MVALSFHVYASLSEVYGSLFLMGFFFFDRIVFCSSSSVYLRFMGLTSFVVI